MKIIVDENVSYGVVSYLRNVGYKVTAIIEGNTAGLQDSEVFELVKKEKATLITRDHHFTNNFRYPPEDTAGIIFIRKGNLTSYEEIELVKWFFSSYSLQKFQGKLITISKNHVKIR